MLCIGKNDIMILMNIITTLHENILYNPMHQSPQSLSSLVMYALQELVFKQVTSSSCTTLVWSISATPTDTILS